MNRGNRSAAVEEVGRFYCVVELGSIILISSVHLVIRSLPFFYYVFRRAASIPRLLMYACLQVPTQFIYALVLLYCLKKRFGEALGTLRSVFVASILRLVTRAQGHSDKCKKHSYIFLL